MGGPALFFGADQEMVSWHVNTMVDAVLARLTESPSP